MSTSCKIIEDLLPLYLDNVCSEQSRQLVEAHLQTCETCKKLAAPLPELPLPHAETTADRAVQKGFKKIRMRWWLSILLVLVLVPVCFLGWNQYHHTSIHYTNIREYTTGQKFMDLLCEGSYEKAYEYLNIEETKELWLEYWFQEEQLQNIRQDGLTMFCKFGEKVKEAGGIEKCEYVGIELLGQTYSQSTVYRLFFRVRFNGKEQPFLVDVSDQGVESFHGGGSFVDDPLAQFSMWSEYLWQEYQGCYFDPAKGIYVYENTD